MDPKREEKEKMVSLDKAQGTQNEEKITEKEAEWEYDMYAPVPSLNFGYH